MSPHLSPGLADPVHDAQRGFRGALQALARPGRIQPLGGPIAGLALGGAMAHLLLTLADEDTPVWWQRVDTDLQHWLRFHTGAHSVAAADAAAFAVVLRAARMPPLQDFRAGTPAAPEQGCTLLVEVPSLQGGPEVQAQGPGIQERITLSIAGLPEGFWSQWQASHAAFPQGVDVFFTCGDAVLGLPRTTRIGRLQEV
jgi:alpha-D-ribose 1-methylphosphonate 5-triphosphate synthase subunit PhnH